MEIKNKNTNYRRIVIVIATIIVALLLGWLSYVYFKGSPSAEVDSSTDSAQSQSTESQQTDQESDAKNKQDFLDAQKDSENNTAPPSDTSTPTISIATQDESNGTVTVFTKLSNISSGACTLSIKGNGHEKVYSADVMYQPNYSSCAGFSINKADIGSGTWTIQLKVQVGDNNYDQETTANIS